MKSTKIYLIFLNVIKLLATIGGDHVKLIRCPEQRKCLENLDKRVLEVINENLLNTTQPCEHFWNYACGSWTAAPYYDHVDNFGAMSNYYADNLIKTLSDLQANSNKANQNVLDLVEQIMTYFLSCKNTGNYYINMVPYLRELPVHKIFGEDFRWSGIFGEHENIWQSFNWLKAVAYLRIYGFKDIFLQESVGFAWNNSRQYVVELKIPHSKINFENQYKVLQIMDEFDLLFFHTNTTKNYLKLAQNLYEFDKVLQNLYKKYEHTKRDHFLLLQDLPNLAGTVDWYLYFGLLLNQEPLPHTPIEFSGDLNYFKNLNTLLKKTPKSILGAYVLIRFCQYLTDIRPLVTERECLLHTNVMFPVGVNYIYNRFSYKNRLPDEEVLQTIFTQLKNEFSKILLQNKLQLTGQEQQYLQDKLRLLQLKIGNLPLNFQDINRHYSTVVLDENNFYYNHLEMLKFRTLQQHLVLRNPDFNSVNLDMYYVNDDISQLRNAPYFIHQRNMLIVPMLFLQLPFYHHTQHPVFHYSLVGWIIAHELSHAFDTHGLHYDTWGKENILGLQLSRKASFLTSVQCLIKHSPTNSLNERMADVNGLQLAWQTFSQRFSNQQKFMGNFSLKQLFFINFAQFFCGSLPQAIAHDRDDIRVRQTVANMREFSEVFHCSQNAKENPADKCNIWRI